MSQTASTGVHGGRGETVCCRSREPRLLPGAGGHSFTFRELARRLGTEQPCYGLHITGLPWDRAMPVTPPADGLAPLRAGAMAAILESARMRF